MHRSSVTAARGLWYVVLTLGIPSCGAPIRPVPVVCEGALARHPYTCGLVVDAAYEDIAEALVAELRCRAPHITWDTLPMDDFRPLLVVRRGPPDKGGVLGLAYYSNSLAIVFPDEFPEGYRTIRAIANTCLHEISHLEGYAHDPDCNTLMAAPVCSWEHLATIPYPLPEGPPSGRPCPAILDQRPHHIATPCLLPTDN